MVPIIFESGVLFELGFYVLMLIFVIHAAIFSYHWVTFGAKRISSLAGITIYVTIGTILLGLIFITSFYI